MTYQLTQCSHNQGGMGSIPVADGILFILNFSLKILLCVVLLMEDLDGKIILVKLIY